VDAAGLVIPYSTAIDAKNPPEIVTFNSPMTRIDEAELAASGGVIPVLWQVRNRPARANLKFEQVLASGEVASVELPRYFLWVRSAGEGAVRPQLEDGNLTLRARLVNVDTGEVYAEKMLTLPVIRRPSPTTTWDDAALKTGAPYPEVRPPLPALIRQSAATC
jgi:hypothetical protein